MMRQEEKSIRNRLNASPASDFQRLVISNAWVRVVPDKFDGIVWFDWNKTILSGRNFIDFVFISGDSFSFDDICNISLNRVYIKF